MAANLSHEIVSNSSDDTVRIGAKLGRLLKGGEVIELISDVGGGKTEFVRGMAKGIGIKDRIMSPTFTVSRQYETSKLALHHFDFYRLADPGVIKAELAESIADSKVAVAIEWSDIVAAVLPADRLRVSLHAESDTARRLIFEATGSRHQQLLRALS